MKNRSTPTIKHGQMVYVDRPPLDASFAGFTKRLVTISNKKKISMWMGLLAIYSVQPNKIDIDEDGTYNTVLIVPTSSALRNEPSTSVSKRLPT